MKVISEEERELSKSYWQGANTRFEDIAMSHEAREETEREEKQRLMDEELKEIADRKEKLRLVSPLNEVGYRGGIAEDDVDAASEQEINVSRLRVFKRARRG